MRPPRTTQSALSHVLNYVLGTEAAVRVLRVVMLSDIPIGAAELARRTSLQASGVARVCERLEDVGVIEAVGRGAHNRQYRRSERFELGGALQALFAAERQRGERIRGELVAAVSGHPNVRAAWLEGAAAAGTDRPEEAIVVGVLAEPAHTDDVRNALWRHLLAVQRAHDVTIELRVMTMADLKTVDRQRHVELEQALPLWGPAPLDLADPERAEVRGRAAKQHGELDARSLGFARAVAERLRRDPSLVEVAVRDLERRLPAAAPGERLELQEWLDVLTSMSVSRLRRFLVQDSPRARRLRQSSPFAAAESGERPAGPRAKGRRA